MLRLRSYFALCNALDTSADRWGVADILHQILIHRQGAEAPLAHPALRYVSVDEG
jgi:hypothetical protein